MTSLDWQSEHTTAPLATARILLVWKWASRNAGGVDHRLSLLVEWETDAGPTLSAWMEERERGGDSKSSTVLARVPVSLERVALRSGQVEELHILVAPRASAGAGECDEFASGPRPNPRPVPQREQGGCLQCATSYPITHDAVRSPLSAGATPKTAGAELSLVLRGGRLLYLRSDAPAAAGLAGGTYELERAEFDGLT